MWRIFIALIAAMLVPGGHAVAEEQSDAVLVLAHPVSAKYLYSDVLPDSDPFYLIHIFDVRLRIIRVLKGHTTLPKYLQVSLKDYPEKRFKKLGSIYVLLKPTERGVEVAFPEAWGEMDAVTCISQDLADEVSPEDLFRELQNSSDRQAHGLEDRKRSSDKRLQDDRKSALPFCTVTSFDGA